VEDLVNGHEVLRVTRRGNGIATSVECQPLSAWVARRGPAGALKSCRRAVEIAPDYVEARTMAGLFLADRVRDAPTTVKNSIRFLASWNVCGTR